MTSLKEESEESFESQTLSSIHLCTEWVEKPRRGPEASSPASGFFEVAAPILPKEKDAQAQ